MERICRIHRAIRDGRLPNCSTLAAELEVTAKTVQRDISFMRDEMRMPLEYDELARGYRYREAVSEFPQFEVAAEELAALFIGRAMAETLGGTELGEKLRSVFARLTRSLCERVELSWGELDEAFSRKAPTIRPREVKLFGELAEAVVRRRAVSFHYLKLGAAEAEGRKVEPWHLGEVEGAWYLIAFDRDRAALRTFALPRISRLRVGATRFERPPDFDGRDHLRRSFGVWTTPEDEAPTLVRVRLKDYAARLARERRWHPTQEVRALNGRGTRVEVCFEAGALEEVVRWVLSFGSKAEVLGPPELKKMVRDELELMRA